MRNEFRYQLVDEPRQGILSRFALPPFLVFIVATVFQPWGYLLVAVNAVTLNGPNRNREIALSLAALGVYFGTLFCLNLAIKAGILRDSVADYLFVGGVGFGMVLIAFAFVSQSQAFQLRHYLNSLGRR